MSFWPVFSAGESNLSHMAITFLGFTFCICCASLSCKNVFRIAFISRLFLPSYRGIMYRIHCTYAGIFCGAFTFDLIMEVSIYSIPHYRRKSEISNVVSDAKTFHFPAGERITSRGSQVLEAYSLSQRRYNSIPAHASRL